MINATTVEEFVLVGFPGSRQVQALMSAALLLVYLVTIAGNIFIIILICTDSRLHFPMYFFLVLLSFIEIFAISTVICKLLDILILAQNTISKSGCMIQSYLYFFLSASDFLLLSVMSIDRFVAVCYPLRYSSIMRMNLCIMLAVGCFSISFVFLLFPTIMIAQLPFCGHVINHFFCDNVAMLKLVCASDISLINLLSLVASVFILIAPLIITSVSYIFIVSAVIRLPSDTGRQKTFSTCVSHFTMVSIVFGSAIFIEIRPSKDYSIEIDKSVHLISTVLGPLLNPFVYTLRNHKVKDCIRDAVKRKFLLRRDRG
ncbi:olfactory receptor 6M1-like [Anomaloglossus baeobatrachus]|uniref:olfactory receptor 6M1-like n=1 Tax=Anomaloglossus baeobatrachus TaxID=238106 RepID=UPI003F504CCE